MSNIFDDVTSSESFEHRSVLDVDYVPDDLVKREEEIEFLKNELIPAVQGGKPSDIFLIGKHGVGKTVSLRWIFQQLDEVDPEDGAEVFTEFVSCNHQASTEYSFLAESINRLREITAPDEDDHPTAGLSYDEMARHWYNELERLYEQCPAERVVLIYGLDEIDTLDSSELNGILSRLSRLSEGREIEGLSLSLVATANDSDILNKVEPGVSSSLRGPVSRGYSPYDGNELRELVARRAEQAFVDGFVGEPRIAYIGALAAKHGGDARLALDILFTAGREAEKQGSDKITEDHTEFAKERELEQRAESKIKVLGEDQLTVLAVVIMLRYEQSHEFPSGPYSNEVYERYIETSGQKSLRTVRTYLQDLAEMGLLSIEEVRADRVYKCYKTDYDVELLVKNIDRPRILEDLTFPPESG